MEIILGRKNESIARKIFEANAENLYISALTAHLVVHFSKNIVNLPILRQFLADYTLLVLESTDFEWAFMNIRQQDIEDALQLAVAIRNGCTAFVTFDKNLARSYKDLVQIETQLLK